MDEVDIIPSAFFTLSSSNCCKQLAGSSTSSKQITMSTAEAGVDIRVRARVKLSFSALLLSRLLKPEVHLGKRSCCVCLDLTHGE